MGLFSFAEVNQMEKKHALQLAEMGMENLRRTLEQNGQAGRDASGGLSYNPTVLRESLKVAVDLAEAANEKLMAMSVTTIKAPDTEAQAAEAVRMLFSGLISAAGAAMLSLENYPADMSEARMIIRGVFFSEESDEPTTH